MTAKVKPYEFLYEFKFNLATILWMLDFNLYENVATILTKEV